MKYLLDVNALIAWRHHRAPAHARFHAWVAEHGARNCATCAHVELGFLRVSMQVFGDSLAEAQTALAAIRKQAGGFIAAAPPPRLAAWAVTPSRTSDAYLLQLAASAGLTLTTFDAAIPGANVIR
ncbi:MAG: type II toxin-antitoxin system VapC family toxin [Opitutaceae bacterium]